MRYRDPNSDWEGSPEKAACYANANEIKPVTKEELRIFTPEIFGGSLDGFLGRGNIGAVNQNKAWPS